MASKSADFKFWSIIFGVLLLLVGTCDNAKILGVFHLPSPSHHIISGALMRELAARGHEVVVASPYISGEKLDNYTEIEIDLDQKDGWSTNLFDNSENVFVKMNRIRQMTYKVCTDTLSSKGLNTLLNSGRTFDVMIVIPVMCEALLGIGHHFGVPMITFMPQGSNVVMNNLFGNTAPYAYVSHPVLPVSTPMTFFDRVANTLINTFTDITMNWYMLYSQEELVKKHFPGAPSLDEIKDQVHLGLFASHPSIETPRPYMPNMIQIGGLHLERPEKLPKALQKLLDGAKNGVIYFNFGSNIKSSQLPGDHINNLLEVFKHRQELVLWKFEEQIENLPKNVAIEKWIPQRGVLSHPNVKVFITHGGLGGVTEAIYNGVPMICIPIFADQFNNCQDSDKKGYAKLIDFAKLNKYTLNHNLNEIINNPKYRASISARSDLFKSQPISSMDKAIFWVEHVIKHKGAEHLKSPARQLNWVQLMLLDVIGFVLLVLGLALGMFYWMLGKIWSLIKGAKKTNRNDKNKSKKD